MAYEDMFEVVSLSEVPLDIESGGRDTAPLVLVVDDEPLVADTLAAVLASSGLSVIKAYNGDSALELALRKMPDLLLSDVRMSGMNGIALAMAVATRLPSCRVLLFSGHATLEDTAEARACGFDFPLLSKPLHPVELLQQVFGHLEWQPRASDAQRIMSARLPLPQSMQSYSIS